jgi:hypothetical protein
MTRILEWGGKLGSDGLGSRRANCSPDGQSVTMTLAAAVPGG